MRRRGSSGGFRWVSSGFPADIRRVPAIFTGSVAADDGSWNSGDERPLPPSFSSISVERRIAAIRAIQIAEAESLLSRLRLLESYFSKEQLKVPALQFFQENLPHLSVIKNEKYNVFELKWKENADDVQASVDTATFMQAAGGGFQLSAKSVKNSFLDAANLQISDFVLDEHAENQMLGMRDAFRTPGETSNRLSFGMTPKTLRVPKNGEMLLSVRGSPLGVYREDNLEAIHESGDGSHDDASQ